jgi:integrase/recombinase XerD
MNREIFDSDRDFELVDKWLKTFPKAKTRAGYSRDLIAFVGAARTPLLDVRRGDLDLYAEQLAKGSLSVNTQNRALSALRSFYGYLHEEGLIEKNPAQSLRLPRPKDTLAERIITEAEYHKMLAHEENPRNALLIELLYTTGGRISEALGTRWKDAQTREDGGQITLFGKNDKTRAVLIPEPVWGKLTTTQGDATDEDYIFPSPRKAGDHLSASQAWRITRQAALKAGIGKRVSPHWFRHAHASHAIDRGAPVSLVRETLGHADLRTTSRYVHARPDDSSSLYLPVK